MASLESFERARTQSSASRPRSSAGDVLRARARVCLFARCPSLCNARLFDPPANVKFGLCRAITIISHAHDFEGLGTVATRHTHTHTRAHLANSFHCVSLSIYIYVVCFRLFVRRASEQKLSRQQATSVVLASGARCPLSLLARSPVSSSSKASRARARAFGSLVGAELICVCVCAQKREM